MKKLATIVVMLCSVLAWGGVAPNQADYNINVHVSSARMDERSEVNLMVVVDGSKYKLRGNGWLLAPGDYKARLTRDEHKTTYAPSQTYEFLLPDKKTRTFNLVGITE
jgi:hypothetical protein